MTVKAEAFLALESALSKRLQVGLRALVSPVYKAVQGALDALDYDEAERLVRSIRLHDLYEKNKSYVAYLTNLAMLFGASRVTRNPGTSVVGLGFEKNTAFNLNQLFSQMVGPKAEAYLITQGVQLIAQLRTVSKAEPQAEAQPTTPRRILRDFQTFMTDSGKAYLDMSSSLHTSRVSAFGFTAEAMALGIEEYQLSEQLDRRICPICAIMHGKKFKVRAARDALEVVTRVADPEELRLLQPWPKGSKAALEELAGLDEAALVSRNWHIPPFHPRCRGLLSRIGTVPTLTPSGEFQPPKEAYGATPDDFTAMLIPPPSKEGLKHWNNKVKTPPLEVAAVMLATSAEKVVSDALVKKLRPALRVRTSSKRVLVSAKRRVGPEAMDHSIAFQGGEATVALASVPAALDWKDYLLGLYLLIQDSGATKLNVSAPGVDLSHLGFKLGGTLWQLDFTDQEAMTSFLG